MIREFFLTSLMCLVLSFVPTTIAQQVQSRPSPVQPSGTLGPALIAWSQVQRPQPINQERVCYRSQPEPAPQAVEKDAEASEAKAAARSVEIPTLDQHAK